MIARNIRSSMCLRVTMSMWIRSHLVLVIERCLYRKNEANIRIGSAVNCETKKEKFSKTKFNWNFFPLLTSSSSVHAVAVAIAIESEKCPKLEFSWGSRWLSTNEFQSNRRWKMKPTHTHTDSWSMKVHITLAFVCYQYLLIYLLLSRLRNPRFHIFEIQIYSRRRRSCGVEETGREKLNSDSCIFHLCTETNRSMVDSRSVTGTMWKCRAGAIWSLSISFQAKCWRISIDGMIVECIQFAKAKRYKTIRRQRGYVTTTWSCRNFLYLEDEKEISNKKLQIQISVEIQCAEIENKIANLSTTNRRNLERSLWDLERHSNGFFYYFEIGSFVVVGVGDWRNGLNLTQNDRNRSTKWCRCAT